MVPKDSPDKSNGYEVNAMEFISRRNPQIGVAIVREWSTTLPMGASVLDLGCGPGVPISGALIGAGLVVFGVDASPRMIAAFRERFPGSMAECAAAEDSTFFNRTFDAVIAWGLIFLLPADLQAPVIAKVARALKPGGQFLFTAPREPLTWIDVLTRRESVSLGFDAYLRILQSEGLCLDGERTDEGDNYYYLASKPLLLPR